MSTKVKEKTEPIPEVGEMAKAREERKIYVISKTIDALEDKPVSVKAVISRLMERRAALREMVNKCVNEADYDYAAKWKTATDEIDKTIYELIRHLEK